VRALTRRRFFRVSTTSVGGLLLCGALPACRAKPTNATDSFAPNPFIQIDPDGTVHIWAPRPDVGEGTRTSLPMLVADELEVEWSVVHIHQADLDTAAYGEQDVGGSDSVTSAWTPLRQAGAVARELLKRAAADAWHVRPGECVAHAGVISHPGSGRAAPYGTLAHAASRLRLPATSVPLKDADQRRLIGQRVPGVDNLAIVTGRSLYGLDVWRPGMQYAAIARSPVAGGTLTGFDDRDARLVPGVRHIVRIEGLARAAWLRPGVAVVADSTWAAIKGRDALRVSWNEGPGADLDSERVRAQLRELSTRPGTVLRRAGDVDSALARAAHIVDATYEVPLVAHVPMEPMNCAAHVHDGRCDVWGPIQMPDSARSNVARAIGLAKGSIAVHPTRSGGSFGRRLASDFAAEAAYVAQAVGTPVQVVWTREDDLQHDFYRPAAYHRVRAGVNADGLIVGWHHRIASLANSMYPTSTGVGGLLAPRGKNLRADYADSLTPCLLPNYQLEVSVAQLPVETGSLRAPDDNANAFVVECVLDELAHAGGFDPLDLRLRLLGTASDFPYEGVHRAGLYNPDRLKGVLSLAARAAGVDTVRRQGVGRGIAGHYTNGSYAAHVIDVDVDAARTIRIRRVVVAIDCGTPVNRTGIEAQSQGGTIDALSGALFGEITLAHGRSQQRNFDAYRWIRNREVPPIEIHVVESHEDPTGLGEIPYPPVAPALANAIFRATGERIRRLPLARHGFTLSAESV
jgi:isoquinoline 1-oxidoreductase beta subunit